MFDTVIAAGGDGTLNQVLNGLLKGSDSQLPRLGLIPLGSGNDFARTCGLRADTLQLTPLLKANRPCLLDVGVVECMRGPTTVKRYFINECSIGMGPEVVRRLEQSNRSLGPGLSYLQSILATFFTHRPQQVTCHSEHWTWEGKARVVAIANGKCFGHAIYIAPDADPSDGVFNTFIAGDVPLLKFLIYLQALKGKSKIKDRLITYSTAKHVRLSAPLPYALEAEGEIMGHLPASISISPRKISFLL
jgi:diacylglycerol kinase (ATP)